MMALLHEVADPGDGEAALDRMRMHRIMRNARGFALVEAQRRMAVRIAVEGGGEKSGAGISHAHGGDIGKRSTADFDALLAEC